MKIMEFGVKDGTAGFEAAGHSIEAMEKKEAFCIGRVKEKSGSMGLILLLVAIFGIVCGLMTVL